MFKKLSLSFTSDPLWNKVLTLSLVLFFVYLGDAILSDWVPGFVQEKMGGSLMMGLIMSFSSLVGFGADFIFPQLLKKTGGNKLLLMAISASLVFCGILFWTTSWPVAALFLLGMAVWGIYYEFLGFGSQLFVAQNVKMQMRSGVWAILGVFKSLAYFLGPVIGSFLDINTGDRTVVGAAAMMVLLGYFAWVVMKKKSGEVRVEQEGVVKLDVMKELKCWWVLSASLWPILLLSLVLGFVDATFWTTGAVLSDSLAKQSWIGSFFLPLYSLPSVFVGFVLAKLGIYRGKKKISELFLLAGGLTLAALAFSTGVWSMLLSALVSGVVLSVSFPMTDAVYSDMMVRMGNHKKHLVGISSSTISISYIVAPILAGFSSELLGERATFAVLGGLVVFVALILLLVTPKKLRLPQREMAKWD